MNNIISVIGCLQTLISLTVEVDDIGSPKSTRSAFVSKKGVPKPIISNKCKRRKCSEEKLRHSKYSR